MIISTVRVTWCPINRALADKTWHNSGFLEAGDAWPERSRVRKARRLMHAMTWRAFVRRGDLDLLVRHEHAVTALKITQLVGHI
jgi:hypothetical protein